MSVSLNIIAKTVKLTVLLLFFPLIFWGQKNLTGLWTGTPVNDSNTIRKDQSFEIALTEYKGKVYGYSRSEFIINDTLYYIVKRVKGTIEGDYCEVKDDEILSYNFRGKLDKGVKVISTFRMNKQDSTWHLDGNWKTTKTKNYFSLSGKIQLQEQKNFSQSSLFPDLEELNLAKDVVFFQEQKKKNNLVANEQLSKPKDLVIASDKIKTKEKIPEPVKIKEPQTIRNESTALSSISETIKKQPEVVSSLSAPKKIEPVIENKSTDSALAKNELRKKEQSEVQLSKSKDLAVISDKNFKQEKQPDVVSSLSVPKKIEPVIESKKTDSALAKNELRKKEQPTVQLSKSKDLAVINNNNLKQEKISGSLSSISETTKKQTQAASSNSGIKKVDSVIEKKEMTTALGITEPRKKEQSVITVLPEIKKNNLSETIAVTEIKKSELAIDPPAAFAAERKSEISQIVNFKSDSLELVLYDNGEVDGDTVSILMNGKVIIPKQGLLAVAYKKKIYIPQNAGDSDVLTMYAENLGKYPPNTGLLIIHDGDDSYQVHFTADLQTNAAVILKRKRSQ